MATGRLLLRQVILSHGHAVPPFPLGKVRRWLEMLPTPEVSRAMDRCTVVLPRPGDGWYAPPSSGASAGFPWGELTQRGVDEMRHQGACWATEGAEQSKVLLRAANRASCVTSAQAFALGARDVETSRSPWEVLVQRGEVLLPQETPTIEISEEVTSLVQTIAESLCTVLSLQLEGVGAAALTANYLRWSNLLKHRAGMVIGPFVSELLHACDVRLDGDDTTTVIYAVDAASLVCMEDTLIPNGSNPLWPKAAESLGMDLWEVEGRLRVSLRDRSGKVHWVYSEGQNQYLTFREHLSEMLSLEDVS